MDVGRGASERGNVMVSFLYLEFCFKKQSNFALKFHLYSVYNTISLA